MARKHTESELLGFIKLYMSGISYRTLVDQYALKLAESTFFGYVNKYQTHGLEGIRYQRTNRKYTKEFKSKIVKEHIETGHGPAYLANKYNVRAKSTVKDWINLYTGEKENKTYSPTSGVYNSMGAKKSYKADKSESISLAGEIYKIR